ncbi:hypothetical protein MPC1_6690001 [Methylocella tundrae]|nr:hypothetical protein MPC1_6690001 [Methylocella tundrae]
MRGAPGIVDLDGPIGRSDGVDAPDSPSPTAASTRSFAANAGAAEAAPGAQADQLVDGADKGDAPLAPASNGPHPRVIDVSEGTPLDPLRDKTYDLNYAKTVPSAKQMVLPN